MRALIPLARELDKATKQLEKTSASSELREAFGEATRSATLNPTTEALERAEQAAKALRRSLAKSGPAEKAHGEAEQAFKLALGRIATDFSRKAA